MCDSHIERGTLQVYLYMPWALNFFGGCRIPGHCFAGYQDLLTECHAIFFWGGGVVVFWGLCLSTACLSCKRELLLPSQKSIVTCCSGCGWKWIIGLTSGMSQRHIHRALTRYARGKTWRVEFPSVGHMPQSFPSFRSANFMRCVGELRITPYWRQLSTWFTPQTSLCSWKWQLVEYSWPDPEVLYIVERIQCCCFGYSTVYS